MADRFARHHRLMHNWQPPGGRLPFLLAGHPVGWIAPDLAAVLAEAGARVGTQVEADPAQLDSLVTAGHAAGLYPHRSERFDVRATPGGPVLATIDRGALPAFGIEAEGVHVNGIVRRPGGPHLWVARRSRHVTMAPGQLDHLVAGGIQAGHDALSTLLKEAAEEANVPPALARQAEPAGVVAYAMLRDEGLRRDRLNVFDLELPEDFHPSPNDDEVEAFELWPVAKVYARVRDTDDFKFNVNFVLIDFFRRLDITA